MRLLRSDPARGLQPRREPGLRRRAPAWVRAQDRAAGAVRRPGPLSAPLRGAVRGRGLHGARPGARHRMSASLVIGLSAVVVAIRDGEAVTLTVRQKGAGAHATGLPFGPFDPDAD